MRYEQFSWLSTTPIAHRGFHGSGAPENSLLAFSCAIEHRYPFELDVQLTRDNQVVVFHDFDLQRVAGVRGKISESTLDYLKTLSLLGTSERIPTIKEVFALCNSRVPILIETKNEGKVGDLESALLREIAEYRGLVALQSFNPLSINYFRVRAPQLPRGQLAGDYCGGTDDMRGFKKFIRRNMLLNVLTRPHFVSYQFDALSPYRLKVLRSRFRSKPTLVWTVRTQEALDKARQFGCNATFEGFEPTA